MSRRFRSLLRDRNGSAAAELALVTPFLLVLLFGALDLGFPYSVDVGGLELACEQSPTTLVPCYGDLVAALRDRGSEFHGALTDAFTHLIDQVFVGRRLDGLPADVVIHGARATLTGGTLHLELDAAVH